MRFSSQGQDSIPEKWSRHNVRKSWMSFCPYAFLVPHISGGVTSPISTYWGITGLSLSLRHRGVPRLDIKSILSGEGSFRQPGGKWPEKAAVQAGMVLSCYLPGARFPRAAAAGSEHAWDHAPPYALLVMGIFFRKLAEQEVFFLKSRHDDTHFYQYCENERPYDAEGESDPHVYEDHAQVQWMAYLRVDPDCHNARYITRLMMGLVVDPLTIMMKCNPAEKQHPAYHIQCREQRHLRPGKHPSQDTGAYEQHCFNPAYINRICKKDYINHISFYRMSQLQKNSDRASGLSTRRSPLRSS
jgi:hypothetical protein